MSWTNSFERIVRELSAENASLNPQRVRDLSLVLDGIQELQNDHHRLMVSHEQLRHEFRDLEQRLKQAGFVI